MFCCSYLWVCVAGMPAVQVRNLMSLAVCQAEAAAAGPAATGGRAISADESSKTLQRAYEMAAAHKLSAIQKEVAVLQVHLACQGGDISKAPGVGPAGKGGAAPAKPAAAAGKAGAKGGAAAAVPPLLDEEGALRIVQVRMPGSWSEELGLGASQGRSDLCACKMPGSSCAAPFTAVHHFSQAVITSKPADKAQAEAMLKDAVAKVDPNPSGSAKGANLGPVARAAWAAAVGG